MSNRDVMRIALQQEIVRSGESRCDYELHGVLLVRSWVSCSEVAELFGSGRRTVHYWVKRFEEDEFAGCRRVSPPGHPTRLDESKRDLIARNLRRSPRQCGYGQNRR